MNCDALSFKELCKLWESISKPLLKPDERARVLRAFIGNVASTNNESLYPLMRLQLPQLDRERSTYGLRETSLARLYAELFTLPEAEALRLRHYRDPSKAMYQPPSNSPSHKLLLQAKVGDFSSILHAVLSVRLSTDAVSSRALSIRNVNDFLDALCAANEPAEKLRAYRNHLADADALTHKWITRIILKDLNLGMGHERILRMTSKIAVDVYNSSGDLKETMRILSEHGTTDAPLQIRAALGSLLFRPLKPMLAKRLLAEKVAETLFASGDAHYFMEPKLDGERLLCHFARALTEGGRDQITFFTRRGNSEYPSSYVPHFADILTTNLKVDECVLDGELLCWDRENERLLPFGNARAASGGAFENVDLFYVLFDCLHLKSKGKAFDLTVQTLEERRKVLKKLMTNPIEHRLSVIEHKVVKSPAEIEAALKTVVETRGEGLVVKDVNSRYVLSARDQGWWKLKPEFGWLADSLDLIVIGAYFSDGVRRRKQNSEEAIDHLSTFLCGVMDTENGKVKSFTKVGTGYTMEELRDLISVLRDHLMLYDAKNKDLPDYIDYSNLVAKTRPDYVVDDLSNTTIMEVIGAEIVPSDSFSAGLTLRFPRCQRGRTIRRDKTWADAETLQAIKQLQVGTQSKKRRKSLSDASDNDSQLRKSSKKGKADPSFRRRPDLFLTSPQSKEVEDIKIESAIFSAASVCVLPFSTAVSVDALVRTKGDVERLIERAGGKVTQTFIPGKTSYVIGNAPSIRSKKINAEFDVNVYSPSFLIKSLEAGKIAEPSPSFCIHASSSVQAKWAREFDDFGDSYFENITSMERMRSLLEQSLPDEVTGVELDPALARAIDNGRETYKIMAWDGESFQIIEDAKALAHVDWSSMTYVSSPLQQTRPPLLPLLLPGVRRALAKFGGIFVAETHVRLRIMSRELQGYELNAASDHSVLLYPDQNCRTFESYVTSSEQDDGRLMSALAKFDIATTQSCWEM